MLLVIFAPLSLLCMDIFETIFYIFKCALDVVSFIVLLIVALIWLWSKMGVKCNVLVKEPSEDEKTIIRTELAHFAIRYKEIQEKVKIRSDELNEQGILIRTGEDYAKYFSDIICEKSHYQQDLEQSKGYRQIMPWISQEVHRQYAIRRIKQEEEWIKHRYESEEKLKESRNTLERAKRLIENDPIAAAECLRELGACYSIWDDKRRMLEQLFGIYSYSPAELRPDILFD